MSIGPELRAASDGLVQALTTLHDLEVEKRRTPVGTPRFVELAHQVEELAREVLASSEAEGTLAEQAGAVVAGGGAELTRSTIEQEVAERDIALIVADWREAERSLAALPRDSHEASRLRLEVSRLRAEYRLAIERVKP